MNEHEQDREAVGPRLDRGVGRLEPERAAPLPCNCPTRDALDAMLCDAFKRRAAVEQALYDMAAGKRPMPDAEALRELARHLGVPDSRTPNKP